MGVREELAKEYDDEDLQNILVQWEKQIDA